MMDEMYAVCCSFVWFKRWKSLVLLETGKEWDQGQKMRKVCLIATITITTITIRIIATTINSDGN